MDSSSPPTLPAAHGPATPAHGLLLRPLATDTRTNIALGLAALVSTTLLAASFLGQAGVLQTPLVLLLVSCGSLCLLSFHIYLHRLLRLDAAQAIPSPVRSALDSLTQCVLVIDQQQNVVLANEAFTRLLGKSSEQLVGAPAGSIPWLGAAGWELGGAAPWAAALATGIAQRDLQLKLRDAQGQLRSFVVNCSPLLASGGKAPGVLVSLEDITLLEQSRLELRSAKDEAEAANRAKSEFLASVSHEIRTPMNAILGFTELLRRGFGKSERESSRYLDTIHHSGRHLLGLINDILDLSKVETGQMAVNHALVPVTPGGIRWRIPSARVLVVDDGPENRELLSLVLAEQGLWVDEAENGQVALEKVASISYDLVLMDMQMPVLDGYAAARELRRRGVILPIVALTAHAMKGSEEEVLQAGCTAYLTKPVDIDALVQQVAQLLGGSPVEAPADAGPSVFVDLIEPPAAEGPIRSRFARDARLVPIVRKFAGRLHEQLDHARLAAGASDLAEVERLAHWLAGAAGTVGYDAFTEPAREMEAAAKAGNAALAEGVLQRLTRMAGRLEIPDVAIA